MTRSTNMEHVEVLRHMKETIRAIMPSEVAALDAAIASLSAPQPPAEAQPVAWEWEYIGVDQYPRGHKVARSLREMDPTNPPYPETWRPTRPLIYGDTVPPSAPVGVWDLPGKWRAEVEAAEPGVEKSYLSDYWLAHLHVAEELEEALAQQPAAVDGAATNSAVAAIQFALKDPEGMTFLRLWNEGDFDTLRREWPDAPVEVYIDADPLAAQQGGSDNDR